jgi:hypothetical protein
MVDTWTAVSGVAVEPVLSVQLLGGLELRLGDSPLPPLESARAGSLLAHLVLHRDAAQPRQRLAFLLWPDSTEQQARTNPHSPRLGRPSTSTPAICLPGPTTSGCSSGASASGSDTWKRSSGWRGCSRSAASPRGR